MNITYQTGIIPPPEEISALYESAGLKRPTTDLERMQLIYENSNLVITAWDAIQLVGISRSTTDFYWSCYLADLAVRKEYQSSGIGKKLLELTKEAVGDQCTLLLLSAPGAMEYYPKIGLETVSNGFIIHRKQ